MRVVYIGKKHAGNKRLWQYAIIAAPIALLIGFGLMHLKDIGAYLYKTAGNAILDFSVRIMREDFESLNYKKHIEEKKSVGEAIIDNINNSIYYYGYLKENTKQETLVVYDPNNIRQKPETETALQAEENTENKEPESEAKPEPPEETIAVNAGGVLKLGSSGPGNVYSLEQLKNFDFLMSNYYVVPSRASVIREELDAEMLLGKDLSIEKNPDTPQILIYHTHSMEGFTDSINGNKDTNIVAVGSYLARLLSEGYGYNVIHCTESFDNVNGVFDRSKAYTYARPVLEQILADNPTIEVILDVHRDGVNENLHLINNVGGKQTAQIMFFNGVSRTKSGGDIDYLYNKNKQGNLAMSLQMKLLAEEYFPGFTRKNYIDAYQYNMDLRERSMLIEVGAQTNSLTEAKNAMEPLAAILDKLLDGDEIN